MTHSITIDLAFKQGISCFDQGVTREDMDWRVDCLKSLGGPYELISMAFYDGWLRRKYGLVDEDGGEI